MSEAVDGMRLCRKAQTSIISTHANGAKATYAAVTLELGGTK